MKHQTNPFPPLAFRTIVELSQWRASNQGQMEIYSFLPDKGEEAISMTYAQLDERAKVVAAQLQSLNARGERVLILYPPGIDYIVAFFGCLYAGAIAVPVYPPRLNRSVTRLQHIIEDASPKIALTNSATLCTIHRRFSQEPYLVSLIWIATDTLASELSKNWHDPRITEETLAFLQYSSGSTGEPKGIMLTHKNLIHNSQHLYRTSGSSSDRRGVSWLPPYHDMGLIGGIIQPLYGGFHMALMSPFSFLQHPIRWLQTISHYRATYSGGPNFAYKLCVNKITPEEKASLDLSSWTFASCGSEPIYAETLNQFTEAFAPCGFRREALHPAYGLAEGTLCVSMNNWMAGPVVKVFQKEELAQGYTTPVPSSDSRAKALVSSGRPLEDQQVLIVNPDTLVRCPPNEQGEIWVAGPSVAQGYWNNPEASTCIFQAHLADSREGPFLRTGDLGFLQDGELFVTGRLKDLIIIRGHNYYPQDIELTAENSHPALRADCTAAFSIEIAEEECLVVVQEVDRRFQTNDLQEVCRAIRRAIVEEHELLVHTVVLIKHGTIPKTSSGKIQRAACRSQFLAHELEILAESVLTSATDIAIKGGSKNYVVPRTPTEQILAQIWAEVLGIEQVGIEDNFIALGGDSLLAVQLISRMREALQVEIPLRSFFEEGTITSIIKAIDSMEDDNDEEEFIPELVPLSRENYRASALTWENEEL